MSDYIGFEVICDGCGIDFNSSKPFFSLSATGLRKKHEILLYELKQNINRCFETYDSDLDKLMKSKKEIE